MFFFVTFAILILAYVGVLFMVDKGRGIVAFGGAVILAVVFIAFSITTVSPRAVGIETANGKFVSQLDNGLHFKRPWAKVEEFSTQVQYMDYGAATSKGDNDSTSDPIAVTFTGNSSGSVETTIRWRIDPAKAQALWAKYKDFDKVRDQLVLSSGRDSFGVQVSKFTAVNARLGDNRRKITDAVRLDLDKELATDGVIIDSVSIKHFDLDPVSQAALDQVVAANAALEQAQVRKQQALVDSEAAKIKQQGGALTPQALQQSCLDLVRSWDVGRQGPIPATFNCALNGTSSTPVIVDTKEK